MRISIKYHLQPPKLLTPNLGPYTTTLTLNPTPQTRNPRTSRPRTKKPRNLPPNPQQLIRLSCWDRFGCLVRQYIQQGLDGAQGCLWLCGPFFGKASLRALASKVWALYNEALWIPLVLRRYAVGSGMIWPRKKLRSYVLVS